MDNKAETYTEVIIGANAVILSWDEVGKMVDSRSGVEAIVGRSPLRTTERSNGTPYGRLELSDPYHLLSWQGTG